MKTDKVGAITIFKRKVKKKAKVTTVMRRPHRECSYYLENQCAEKSGTYDGPYEALAKDVDFFYSFPANCVLLIGKVLHGQTLSFRCVYFI